MSMTGAQPAYFFGQGTGAAIYHRLGFCPVYVRLWSIMDSEDVDEWALLMANATSISVDDSDGNRDAVSSGGISLVEFDEEWANYLDASATAPSAVEPGKWYQGNGISIGTSCQVNVNGVPYMGIAYPLGVPVIRSVHDGGASNVHWQDSSLDFQKCGVEGGQQWIIINEDNDNYAYVKEVQKPAGQSDYCRLTLAESADGTATAAAAIADADKGYIIRKDMVQYPLSGIGAMT